MAQLVTSGRRPRAALMLLATVGLWLGAVAPASASASAKPATPAKRAVKAARSPQATITANWEAFFSAKTPVKRKIALVQDGSAFAQVIHSQAGNSLAATATAKVLSVKVKGKTAAVTYTVYVGGQPALKNQKGEALLQDGTWKVGAESFCGLLSLEGTKVPACKAAPKAK